jgi:TonB family protein
MNDTERETPVIFTWADREGSSWWLAAFIFLSFVLHSAAFFVFHGKDPIPPRTVRTAPVVQILTASSDPAGHSPEGDALLQWIATHDPALVAKVQTVEPKGLLDVPYRPSFLTLRTPPLAAPPEPPTIRIPPALDPLALIRSMSPSEKPTLPTPAPQPTQVRLSSSLQSRAPDRLVITPGTKTSVTVEPATVLAGVTAEGEPRFAFVQQASGDRALDAEALAFVHTLRFAPSGEALQWGTITIAWGDDATALSEAPR